MSLPHAMRSAAREMFLHALAESSIEKAFTRHLSWDRGVLRIREDLYDLKSYNRVLVVSFVKAGHRMAEILSRLVGTTVEGIIADPTPHPYPLNRSRYFAAGDSQPNDESSCAASAFLKA